MDTAYNLIGIVIIVYAFIIVPVSNILFKKKV